MTTISFYDEFYLHSYNIFILEKLRMCFIKAVYGPLEFNHSLVSLGCDQGLPQFQHSQSETPMCENLKQESNFDRNLFQNTYHSLLLSLLSTNLTKNSYSMNIINKQIAECEEKIDDLLNQLEETQNGIVDQQKSLRSFSSKICLAEDLSPMKQQLSENVLTNKLFGQKKYRYTLALQGDFSEVIYKERNIKVNLSLRNLNGKIIKNSNVLNLCFALADDNGNWINLNRVGDPMLKGKTEVQLYHGEAQFNKIYTKDISRTFPNGKVNIAIYAKPSILIYNGLASEYEEHIDQSCVQPLIISDISIKAKKKY